MVKYLEIHKCEECPHYDIDPQIEIPKFWGKHVCIYWWNKNEEELKIIEDFGKEDFPEWCPLDGPNDL